MPLLRKELPALYNGVSQQPVTLRLPSQAEVQINCYSSVVDGVAKRPGAQHVAVLSATALGSAYIHTINRDTTEQYSVVVTSGTVKVFDMAGNQKTVNVGTGFSSAATTYLTSSAPATDFSAVTVADYTFIVNKNITVAMKAVAADQSAQSTSLAALRRLQIGGAYNYYTQYGPNPSGSTLQGSVQTFADLPKTPANGDLYHVMGSSTDSGFGGYYVVRTAGVWNETVAPGLSNALDETTMPWALIREANGTFTFTPFSWKPRSVGDEKLNPNPSFVGRKIREVFFYRNRLGLTADENAVFSAVGDFGNFYRLTVLTLLASDVVDLAVSSTKVSYLNFAVPFYTNLMLFSDQTQFQLNVNQVMTPSTCSLDTVTQYEMSKVARPAGVGSDLYYVSEKSAWATVWDYYVQATVIVNTAEDITSHVPRYIPKGVIKMVGSLERDMLFILTTGAQSALYVYKFYWVSGKKVQSCWSVWQFDPNDTILNVDVLQSKLYMIVQRGTQVVLQYVDLLPLAVPADLTFDPLLDKRVPLTGVYSAGPNTTAFTLPYACTTANFNLVRGGAFSALSGALVDPSTYTFSGGNTIVTVPGNVTAGPVYAGEVYNQTYQFSQPFQTDQQGVAITSGRYMIKSLTVNYVNTAYFQTSVDAYGNGAINQLEDVLIGEFSNFDAKVLGTSTLKTGTPVFASGAYSFTVMADSVTAKVSLLNNTFVQSRFVSAEWEMLYHNRAQ
jgi:hypothetical protein